MISNNNNNNCLNFWDEACWFFYHWNKGRSSKFREGSRVRQTPEKGRRTYQPKRCGNNNKDDDNSPKNLNDNNNNTNGSPNLGQKTRPYSNQQKKRICKIVNFAVPADHRIKLKECEKKNKYLDFAREFKKNYETWRGRLYQSWLMYSVQ